MKDESYLQKIVRRQMAAEPLPREEILSVLKERGIEIESRSDDTATYVANISYADAVEIAVQLGAVVIRRLVLDKSTGELFKGAAYFFNQVIQEVGYYDSVSSVLVLCTRAYGAKILDSHRVADEEIIDTVLRKLVESYESGRSTVNSFTLEGEPRIASLVEEYMRRPSSLDEIFTLDSITSEQGNDMKDSKDRLVDGDGRELKADPSDPPVRVSFQVYETLGVNMPNGPDIPVGSQILHQRVFETEELKHKYERTAENFADAVAEKSLGTERIVMISDGLHTQVMTFRDAQSKWHDEYFPNPGSRGGFNWGKAPINEPNRVMEESTNDYLRTADLAAAESRIVEAAMDSVGEINNELSSGQEAMSSRAALEQFEELLRQPASPPPAQDKELKPEVKPRPFCISPKTIEALKNEGWDGRAETFDVAFQKHIAEALDKRSRDGTLNDGGDYSPILTPSRLSKDPVKVSPWTADYCSLELQMLAAAGISPSQSESTPVFASEPTGRWSCKTPVVQELKHKWKVGIVVHLPVECIDIDTIIIWLDESMVERLLWEELIACAGTTASVKLNYVGSDEADSLVLLTSNSGLRDAICVDAEDVVGVESLNNPAVRVYLRQSLCYVIKR